MSRDLVPWSDDQWHLVWDHPVESSKDRAALLAQNILEKSSKRREAREYAAKNPFFWRADAFYAIPESPVFIAEILEGGRLLIEKKMKGHFDAEDITSFYVFLWKMNLSWEDMVVRDREWNRVTGEDGRMTYDVLDISDAAYEALMKQIRDSNT